MLDAKGPSKPGRRIEITSFRNNCILAVKITDTDVTVSAFGAPNVIFDDENPPTG